MVLGEADQFTGEAALRRGVLDSGGCLLRRDDSYLPEADEAGPAEAAAGSAAAAAAAGAGTASGTSSSGASSCIASSSGGGSGSSSGMSGKGLPAAERRPLLLRVFPESDHFWLSHGSMAAEYAVGWLETLMLRQEGAAEAAEAAQERAGGAVAEAAAVAGTAAAAAPEGAAAGGVGCPAGSS
jgi:hypothetical protein